MANTPSKTAAAPKAEEKKTRQTPAQKAQKALDVTTRKIENVDKRLAEAKADVVKLETERKELLAVRDYQANHPALAATEPTPDAPAPGDLPGTEV